MVQALALVLAVQGRRCKEQHLLYRRLPQATPLQVAQRASDRPTLHRWLARAQRAELRQPRLHLASVMLLLRLLQRLMQQMPLGAQLQECQVVLELQVQCSLLRLSLLRDLAWECAAWQHSPAVAMQLRRHRPLLRLHQQRPLHPACRAHRHQRQHLLPPVTQRI